MYVENIKRLCQDQDITVKELAEKIGMSFSGLYAAFNNDTLKINAMLKICEVLNVDPCELLKTPLVNPEPFEKTGITFFNDYIFYRIEVLSKRYDNIVDQINFIKDYYVWTIVNMISLGYNPKSTSNKISKAEYLVSKDQFQAIRKKLDFYESEPFSTWRPEDQELFFETRIIHNFYFVIFDKNYLNLRQFLDAGWDKDQAILNYYKEWKNG